MKSGARPARRHRRARFRRSAATAFGAALVVGLLAIATNIATGAIPAGWWWAQSFPLMACVVAVLLILSGVLAAQAATTDRERSDGRPTTTPPDRPGVVVAGRVPALPTSMQDRTEIRNAIHLIQEESPVVCVVGVRGTGKTQLAAAVARHVVELGWTLVAWINADTRVALVVGFADLSDRLGLTEPGDSIDVAAGRLREHLQTRTGPALVVLDNAEDADAVRELLPGVGSSRILVTSTRRAMASLGVLVPVSSFSRRGSVTYLGSRTQLDDELGAARVAEELGDLPLALAQAATVVTLRSRTYGRYLDLLRTIDVDALLVRSPGDDYPMTTAAAILMSVAEVERIGRRRARRWRRLRRHRSGVGRILLLMAVLPPSGVSHRALGELVPPASGGARDTDAAVELLVETSLLSWTTSGDSSLVMHRVVARVIRDRAADDDLLGALDDVIAHVVTTLSHAHHEGRRHDIETLVEHALTAWDHILTVHRRRSRHENRLAAVARCCADALWELVRTGHEPGRAAMSGTTVLAESEEFLGPDHDMTLYVGNLVAYAHIQAGHPDDAVQAFEAIVRSRRRTHGPDAIETLLVADNLAGAFRDAGRLEDSIALFRANLQAWLRFGDIPDGLLVCMRNLCAVLGESGRHAERVVLSRKGLALCSARFGEEALETLSAAHSLAVGLSEAGHETEAEAVDLLQRTFEARRSALGDDHPDTLETAYELAFTLLQTGARPEAVALLERAVLAGRDALGWTHPTTLRAASSLTRIYAHDGNAESAVALGTEVLRARREILGEDHPATAEAANDLGVAYHEAGRLDLALPLYENVMRVYRRRQLGDDDGRVVKVRSNMEALTRALAVTATPAEPLDDAEEGSPPP